MDTIGVNDASCIRCGRCVEYCPMGLEPVEVNQAYAARDVQELGKLHVDYCFNCGSCTFVCPAKRPCTPMMGLHPTSINDNPRWREELALVERYLCSPPEGVGRFCAVGEIGLDYYWDDRFKAEQLEAFTKQCRLAATYDLPVAIHTRAAWKDMCRTVETETKAAREKGLRLRGVFHAFAEDADTYRQLKECGDFLFGIGGVVTFKKSRLADTVREMELDDLVLETDCPYLTPVPYRGQRNESGYIPYICNKIAALKGTTPEEVAAATTRNARRMFGFDAARQTTNDHSSPTESI